MVAESLNSSSLYSSEAVRWQLLISMLIIFPQPGKAPLHCQFTGAKEAVLSVLNSHSGEVRRGEGVQEGVIYLFILNKLHRCIHGKQRRTRQTA